MTDQNTAPPPEARLLQVMFGFMVTRGLSVAAALNVADELEQGPRYYTDLARAVDADQRSLHRILRMLVSVGIFAETEPGTYALNDVAELLRSDHPASMRDLAVMLTSESHWLPWGKLGEVVRTGASGARHAFGTDLFSWFQEKGNRDEWKIFNAAMTSFSSSTARLVTAGFDFSGCRRIVDIGGGHGLLLSEVLEHAPQASGVLFDLPGVLEGADGLDARVECVGGDFFESVPSGGDTYLLKHILHDWSDEQCLLILRNIAAGMDPQGRVLAIETVMPESTDPHPAKFMDVNMLAMTEGGCERTESEYAELFDAAGLRLVRTHPTAGPVSIVEAALA